MGSSTTAVLLPLLAVHTFHAGPEVMGVLTAAAWLPWLIIGLPAGAWLDQLDPRRVMILADLFAAAALASVPIAWMTGVLSVTQLVIVALLTGAASVFFRAGYPKLLPTIVGDQGLEKANARLLGTESATQIGGPGVAGVIVEFLSAATGVLLDVASFLVSALCLSRIRPAPSPAISDSDSKSDSDRQSRRTEPMYRRIAEGIRTVLADRTLRALMIIGGVSNFGLTGYQTLLVLYLLNRLELSTGALSAVLMVGSLGGVLGTLLAPALARRIGAGRASTLLFLCAGPTALLVGAPTRPGQEAVTALGLLVVGAGVVGGNAIRGAWRQRYVPADLIGRVVTTSQIVNFGGMPLAGLAAGALGSHIGVRAAILGFAAIHCLATLSILTTAFGRHRDLPSRPPQTDKAGPQ